MNDSEQTAKPHLEESPHAEADALRMIRSEELLAGKLEVLIEHDGQTYRLRLTRSGKLILHK
jgi:hemin uptake protein HemP